MDQKPNLEKHRHLEKSRLDPYHYTLSLLQQGYRLNLISRSAMDATQAQVLELLADAIRRYTRGESSSVTNETAQRIMGSIFYALDARLRELQHPDEALEVLQSGSVADHYRNGLEILEACLADTWSIYQELMSNRLTIANLAYNSTLESFPAFFDQYDPRFAAQDTTADIDYPLLMDDMKASGLFYIRRYLLTLSLEIEFCQSYGSKEIKSLLASYARTYRVNTNEALINIFDIVATNALFSELAGNARKTLSISPAQLERLEPMLAALNRDERLELLQTTSAKLLASLPEKVRKTDPWAAHTAIPTLSELMDHLISTLMPRLDRALEFGNLHNVIIVNQDARDKAQIVFNAGVKMDDDSFRQLVGEILACNNGAAKAALIIARTESLADFIDILEADCLYGREYQDLYSQLGDMELALLARMVFIEELQADLEGFSLQSSLERHFDYPFQDELCRFLKGIPESRLLKIEQLTQTSLEHI